MQTSKEWHFMLYNNPDAGMIIFRVPGIYNACAMKSVKFSLIYGLCNEHYAPLVFTLREIWSVIRSYGVSMRLKNAKCIFNES